MRFLGRLQLPNESGPGLDVVVEIQKTALLITSEGEQVGRWPIENVRATRLEGELFELDLAYESFLFLPNDRITFAYNGLPTIEANKEKLTGGWRNRFTRARYAKPAGVPMLASNEPPPVPQPEPPPAPSEPEPKTVRSPAQKPSHGPAAPPVPPVDPPDIVDPPSPPAPDELTQGLDEEAPAASATEMTTEISEAVPDVENPERPVDSGEGREFPADPFAGDLEENVDVVVDLRDDEDAEEARDEITEPLEPPGATSTPPSNRVSLLDRVRRSRSEHVHTYTETKIAGGLTRRLCEECHHVSIGVDRD